MYYIRKSVEREREREPANQPARSQRNGVSIEESGVCGAYTTSDTHTGTLSGQRENSFSLLWKDPFNRSHKTRASLSDQRQKMARERRERESVLFSLDILWQLTSLKCQPVLMVFKENLAVSKRPRSSRANKAGHAAGSTQ